MVIAARPVRGRCYFPIVTFPGPFLFATNFKPGQRSRSMRADRALASTQIRIVVSAAASNCLALALQVHPRDKLFKRRLFAR